MDATTHALLLDNLESPTYSPTLDDGLNLPLLLTLEQVAGLLNISLSTARSWRARKTMNCVKINGCVRIHRDEVYRLIEGKVVSG